MSTSVTPVRTDRPPRRRSPRRWLAENALRATPPPAPRRLLRLPDSGELATPLPGPAALDVVEEELRVRRFRVVRRGGPADSAGSSGTAWSIPSRPAQTGRPSRA